jgi:hypothetical protein
MINDLVQYASLGIKKIPTNKAMNPTVKRFRFKVRPVGYDDQCRDVDDACIIEDKHHKPEKRC